MTKKKAKRKDSVLARQKPRKGKRPLRQRLKLWGLSAATVIVVATGVYGWVAFHRASSETAASSSTIDWQVSLKLDESNGAQPLDGKAQEAIIATAKRYLGRGSKRELTRTARAVQQLESYADVHVLKLSRDHVAVHVKPRTAVMCIEADRLRFVSTNGEVYGQAEKSQCPGPVLAGVFESGARLPLQSGLTVAVGDEEKGIIRDAVELLRQAKAKGLTVAGLESRRYRGLFMVLQGSDTEVAMGRAPFPSKLDKLQGILDKLSEKHEQAVSIELDYQGKAFIKRKKM